MKAPPLGGAFIACGLCCLQPLKIEKGDALALAVYQHA